jgi:hypothetical protein
MSLALYSGTGAAPPDVERRFFDKLRLPNGTYKTTYRRRLDDVNDLLLTLLPNNRTLDIMDVAISSGFSTVEWSDHLAAHGVDHKLVAGDLLIDAWLTSWGEAVAVVFDSSGRQPLLLEVGSLAIPVRSDRLIARAVRPLLFVFLRAMAAIGRRASAPQSEGPSNGRRFNHRSISLVTPELLRREEIEIIQDDLIAPGRFPLAFDVIRAANLVQRVYFDDATLTVMLTNLRSRLRDGGLLIICRTMSDGVNNATIFRRAGDRLVSEVSINAGAEVSDLAVALS